MSFPSPKELDTQCIIFLDGWVDLNSERWREVDDNPSLTKQFLKVGFEESYLFTDLNGRVWGKGENGRFYPYHLEYGKKKYGIRIATKAAN